MTLTFPRFHWVQLSLDNPSTQRTARKLREALQRLPGTYADILGRIAPDDWEYAREALFWLSFAKRPLTLRGLNEAVAVKEGCTVFDEDMMLLPPNILLHICQGLISMDQSGHVNLAHYSVKEFLTSDWIRTSQVHYFYLDPATASTSIMRRCLAYMCLENFTGGYASSEEEATARKETYQFISYAAYWPQHGVNCEIAQPEQELIHRFFETRHLPHRGNYGVWIETLIPGVDAKIIEMTHPLYYAASFGLLPVVKAILASEKDLDLNARGGRVGATPLLIAAWRRHYEVVDVLIKAGADSGFAVIDENVLELAQASRFSGLRKSLNWWRAQRGR